MLKRTLKFAATLLAASIVLTACGVGTAHAAQPSATTFVSTYGQVASLENVLTVDPSTTPGTVYLNYTNSVQVVMNDSGALMNKILTKYPHFVQIPGSGKWLNPNVATSIACYGGVTTLAVSGSTNWGFNDPGCQMFSQIKANSN